MTYQDRESIAAGLAAGLGYAQIARRLRRPASTVSREVHRNGGNSGYSPEHAQQATDDRARRIQHAGEHRPSGAQDFERLFAQRMVETGLPQMPAAVLACLLVAESNSMSASQLIRRLGVSPASVSRAVGYLEQLRLIRRARDAAERRERYVIDDDVWYRSCLQQVQICLAWAETAREGTEILAGTEAARRLRELGQYFDHVGHDLAEAAERWRHLITPLHSKAP
ncbi:helix-turn-helix domain-containing protein [Kribbella hippodromi]|uniref:Helix-turn-helix domain-containing protein n=1 Tax=Kribbella hippodromi TaxID=434347 RepID=A0ABN2E292_9ACTN